MLTIGSTPPIVSTATAMLSRPPATGIVSINLVSINLVRTAAVTPRCRALVTEGDNRARMSQASRAPIPRGWRPCRKQSGWHADCPVRRARLPRPECAFLQWRSRAACCLAGLREQREREAALGGVDVELARKWGEPRVLGAALHAQALVKATRTAKLRCVRRSRSSRGSPAKLEHAWSSRSAPCCAAIRAPRRAPRCAQASGPSRVPPCASRSPCGLRK